MEKLFSQLHTLPQPWQTAIAIAVRGDLGIDPTGHAINLASCR